MVKLNELKAAKGARKAQKRVGRGRGAGSGCTAGRGNNGARARRGHTNKLYFEGGQTPLSRRLPKKGFTNIFKKVYQIVNVGDLAGLDVKEGDISPEVLAEHGLIRSADEPVKILGKGECDKELSVVADAFSKSAREKLKGAKVRSR